MAIPISFYIQILLAPLKAIFILIGASIASYLAGFRTLRSQKVEYKREAGIFGGIFDLGKQVFDAGKAVVGASWFAYIFNVLTAFILAFAIQLPLEAWLILTYGQGSGGLMAIAILGSGTGFYYEVVKFVLGQFLAALLYTILAIIIMPLVEYGTRMQVDSPEYIEEYYRGQRKTKIIRLFIIVIILVIIGAALVFV